MNKTLLAAEFTFIFVFPPLLVVTGLLPKEGIMPMLWVISLYAYLFLRSSKIKVLAIDFDKKALYIVIKRFLVVSMAMTLFILLYMPEQFLTLPKNRPWFWLTVMLFYPILSAFTQEVLFRSFFFHRYKKFFKKRLLLFVIVNALTFAYVHIVFGNWIAVTLTFFGGLLFAQTYLKSRSTLLTAIEHSLYGNTLYTLGLGHYFYHGANI
ncbi:MAG: CPBP family intramembrane glutamic endopeptidase [Campylobacterota bacterium]